MEENKLSKEALVVMVSVPDLLMCCVLHAV